MCKKLRDILFPTNIKGEDIRTFSIDASKMRSGTAMTLSIQWAGERIDLSYAMEWHYHEIIQPGQPDNNKSGVDNFNIVLTDGQIFQRQYEAKVFISYPDKYTTYYLSDNLFHLKCTNVTLLVVNGQILI